MNTISSLETTDLPAAYHMNNAPTPFRGVKKPLPATRAALSQLSVNAKRQNGGVCDYAVVLDEATLFNIAVDPDYQRRDWEGCCWNI